MNVWFFSHYASIPSIGQYTGHYDLARGLVAHGHDVTIFASSFSHYKFCETRLSAGEKLREEVVDGVRFVWLRTPQYHANDWHRYWNMLVYFFRAVRYAAFRKGHPDVCVGVCVHPLAGLAAYLIAKRKRAAFVYEIRDLWPVVLIEMGRIRATSLSARILRALERFLVRRAVRVVGAWRKFDDYVEEIGEDRGKVVWLPQFADLSRLPESVTPEPGPDPFTVMYTGGYVSYMGLDVVLRAAKILQNSSESVRFVFVGGGQEKSNLLRLAEELRLKNVEFREPVSKERLYQTMAEANAFIISLRALPHHRFGVSLNKLCDYLAMRRPIIYATASTYNPVREVSAGISVPPEAPEAIARAVVELKKLSPEERRLMGERGYRYVCEYHEREIVTERLENVLLAASA